MTHRRAGRRRATTRLAGSWRLAVAAALAFLVAGALPACGGDDEPVATTPTTTGPTGSQDSEGFGDAEGKEPEGGGAGQPAGTESPTGGEPDQPAAGGTPPPASEEDTEEHDIPPPPGSPAEQFEQECEAHPEICE